MGWVLAAASAALLGWGVWIYNRLVHDRNLVAQALADVDVQLKRRADLVPRLVQTVRGNAAHEKAALAAVAELRGRLGEPGGHGGAAGAGRGATDAAEARRFADELRLGAALRRLVLLQENYPRLKADANFRDLVARLVEVEDHLQYARRFYNGAVKQYLTRTQTFPDLLVARAFAFRPAAFFGTDDRAAVEVKL